jgi:signal transduction histidine kinase
MSTWWLLMGLDLAGRIGVLLNWGDVMPMPGHDRRRVLFINEDRSIRKLFRLILASGRDATTQRTRNVLDAHISAKGESDRPRSNPGESAPSASPPPPAARAFLDIPGSQVDVAEMLDRIWKAAPELQVVICSAPETAWEDITASMAHDESLSVLEQRFDCIGVLLGEHTRAEMAELAKRLASRTMELEETQRRLDDEQRERERMEAELRLAQKLESVGQLASGIAHEINSPMQYIGDSLHFLQRAFHDLLSAFAASQACVAALEASGMHEELTAATRDVNEALDVQYLQEQIPRAFERTLEGVDRVSSIVQAMRDFAHPDVKRKSPADLNRALESTLAVCRNEYKYIADVDVDWGELPRVECHLGEINQVFLNLIVNAAHAIEDSVRGTKRKGAISIRTRTERGVVVVSIEDNGTGIPENIRDRIFDPFFTTKPVGKGTGQGLAIARSIVVDKHGGRLTFESRMGHGTRFDVELPVVASHATPGGPAADSAGDEKDSCTRLAAQPVAPDAPKRRMPG